MEVVVRCYGEVREAVGAGEVALSLDPGATAGDALDRLSAEAPALARLRAGTERRLVVRRDRSHVDPATPLADGDALGVSTSPMPE